MNKKKILIFSYILFGLFILANIIFFTSNICYACEESLIQNQIIKSIPLNEWKNKLNDENIIILDIRTNDEYNNYHLDNSINIDFYDLNFKKQLDTLDKKKVYLIYCRSGNRGNQALSIFKELGFKEVYNLEGGIINWK